MTEIGRPEQVPEIEVVPLEDPVPRVMPKTIPNEPEFDPDYAPAPAREVEPELVPV